MASNYRLKPHDVIYILQSGDSDAVVAQRLGVSRQAVNHVRCGKSYRKVAPQLPRRDAAKYTTSGALCTECMFWAGYGCSFGFPEPLKDLCFAQECSMRSIYEDAS